MCSEVVEGRKKSSPAYDTTKILNELLANDAWLEQVSKTKLIKCRMWLTRRSGYSGDEIRPFEIRKHLKSGLFDGRISLAMAIAIVPTIWKPDLLDVFVQISNCFWLNGCCLSGFQMEDLGFHSKSGPFANQPLLDLKKSWLVQISGLRFTKLYYHSFLF